jgi:hypothetical protein
VTVGDHRGGGAQQGLGRLAGEGSVVDGVQLFQHVAAVHQHAIVHADALVGPLGRIGPGADRVRPGEARFVRAGETHHAARPVQEAREPAQRARRDRQTVDGRAREVAVHLQRVAMLAGRHEQLAAGIAPRDLPHEAGDAGHERREFIGQQEGLGHHARC